MGSDLTSDGNITASTLVEGTHHFYHTLARGSETSECSSLSLIYLYDTTAPSDPTASTSGSNDDPTISVSGLVPDDQVTLFSEATCATPYPEAEPQMAVGNSLSFQLQDQDSGNYTFFVQANDLAGNTSGCVSAGTFTIP